MEKKPYESKWQPQTDVVVQQMLDRKPFQYDVNEDALYNQVKDQYIASGRMAMQDTMGQAQTMTGGYGNSYAQMAGQQAYHGYLQGLTDRIPDFYQMALNQYLAEGDNLMDRYGLLTSQDSIDYGRYQDDVAYNQWLTEYLENKRRYDQEWEASQMGGGRGRGGGGGGDSDTDTDSIDAPTYNQVKNDYINATKTGITASERDEFLNATVKAGYISQQEADKIASIYKAPSKKYTAGDQMWDRHS